MVSLEAGETGIGGFAKEIRGTGKENEMRGGGGGVSSENSYGSDGGV